VKWSTIIGGVIGFVLPVPLILLVDMMRREEPVEVPHADEQVAPILPLEEQKALQTFGRDCWKAEDCESPLGCLYFAGASKGFCGGSTCQADFQCGEDWMCQTVRTLGRGALIRTCVPPGMRREGEACVQTLGMDEETCALGFHCNAGWCGRSCQPEEPTSCPRGFFCREGLNGPSCLPTCEATGCREGQECISLGEGLSVCAVVRGENCQKVPCSDGGLCSVWPPRYKESRLELKMACTRLSCSEDGPGCPQGTTCVQGVCRHVCDPGLPDAGPTVCPPRHP
jgi:hypothetical protein